MRITSALGSQRQLAKRFRVSLTFIEKLLQRYRTDGTVEPRAHGGGQVAKLSREQEAVLTTLIEENNDAILVELCDRLEQSVGVRVSRARMGRYVQNLKLTPEKKLCTQRSATVKECSSCGWNIGMKLEQSTWRI